MSMRKTRKYDWIIGYIRCNGLIVRHCKLQNELNGAYDSLKKQILINSEIRGTILGCYVLFHEYRHYLQHVQNLTPQFNRGYTKYKPKFMRQIIEAEQDAAKFSQKMLKGLGLKFTPPELLKENLKEFTDFWREYYFDD